MSNGMTHAAQVAGVVFSGGLAWLGGKIPLQHSFETRTVVCNSRCGEARENIACCKRLTARLGPPSSINLT